jgi:hypothetical protein
MEVLSNKNRSRLRKVLKGDFSELPKNLPIGRAGIAATFKFAGL